MSPYPHNLKIEGFTFKEESSYGTDSTPAPGDDGIRVVGRLWPSIQPEWAFPNRREDVLSNSLVKAPPGEPAGRIVSFEVVVELKGAGAAYSSTTPVRPEADPLLIACGLARTHVDTSSSESVTYAQAATGHGSGTAYVYAGGKLFKIVGCRGNVRWPITAGEQGRLRFRFSGMLSTTPTEVSVPSITYDSVKAPVAKAMALAIVPSGGSSWSPSFRSAELDAGFEVVQLDDANATDAIEGFFITDMDPRFTLQARAEDLSDYNPYSEGEGTKTAHTIDLTLGDTQYNRVKLDVDAAYLDGDPPGEEDNQHAAWRLEYECQDSALVFD